MHHDNLIYQTKAIYYLSLVGISSLLIFGGVNFWGDNYLVGSIEWVTAGLGLLNLLILRMYKNPGLASSIVLFLMIFILSFLVTTGGFYLTGLYWIFTFPLLAFFLKGRRQGFIFIFILLGCIVLLEVLSYLGHLVTAYSFLTLRQALASFLAVTLLVYFYEKIRAGYEESLLLATKQITDQNKLIEKSQAKDKAVLASVGEGLVVVDNVGKFVVFNKQAKDIMGVGTKDISPQDWPKTYGMHYLNGGGLMDIKDFKSLKAFKGDMVIGEKIIIKNQYQPQGIIVKVNAAPVMTKKNIIGVVFTFSDVTKEEEIDKMKSEFVSLASHQLRSPLTGIRWSIELLLKKVSGKLGKEEIEHLKEVLQTNNRLIKLVQDLLSVSRIETGNKFNLEKEPTDLVLLLNQVMKQLTAMAKDNQVAVVKDKSMPKKVVANIDKLKMAEVINNLVHNAIKYSKSRGKVQVGIEDKKSSVVVFVKDTGIGIPKSDQSKIFQKFFRAKNALVEEGTGLGLYIVKAIVEKHGGRVWLESQENKGTTFYLEIKKN